jgi:hypothetical protein
MKENACLMLKYGLYLSPVLRTSVLLSFLIRAVNRLRISSRVSWLKN